MKNDGELKPCPFCGKCDIKFRSWASDPESDLQHDYARVTCSCGTSKMGMGIGKCKEEAIKAWNSRHNAAHVSDEFINKNFERIQTLRSKYVAEDQETMDILNEMFSDIYKYKVLLPKNANQDDGEIDEK